ncbi:MAG: methylcrotonoyl-CoA carboxylase [Elusimicrobia bacterium]|nr:methylcrotonoyl-CoA carboxylase [Elusimicrobiota bacterium]
MPVIASGVNRRKPEFLRNSRHHRALVADLRKKLALVKKGGPPHAVQLHRKRDKMTARERVRKLVDPGSEFLELSPLAAWGQYDGEVPGAGLVTGIGRVAGRECVIVANDATVKGGCYYPETIKKHLRAQEIALENKLPALYLVDSGGVFLPRQYQVFPDKDHFGRIFYNQAVMSAASIPQIAVVMGMCTAGGAYVPAMADESVIVRGGGTIYLAGPPLVRAAIGEDSNPEELGGGDMHSKISGVTDHLADSDAHALMICRAIVDSLPPQERPDLKNEEPRYPATDLYGILNRDLRRPTDVKEIIARLVDASRFLEFKANYGQTLVCGFAKIMGRRVGLIANQGILFSESALKGAHFVELCGQRGLPIIFLQNITGFMVGKNVEQGGIVKHGAKLVQAVSTVNTPKLTLIIGASNGAGNYAMCGRAYGPRFLFTWPGARVSVMGADQAASVMVTIKRQQLQRDGRDLSHEEAQKISAPVREQYEREGSPYFGTSRLWDDGILDPVDTRGVLGRCLAVSANGGPQAARYPVFRM